jgi:hypothetical protein
MAAAEHVLCYLRGTLDQSIHYSCDANDSAHTRNVLWGWVDSDWAANVETHPTCHRSHTGYILMLNGGAISWKSRHQDSVSLFTSEAEFVPVYQCGQEVLYLLEILHDFAVPQLAPTDVYEDNLACVAMSENPVRCKFSSHIDICRYFVRELVGLKVLFLFLYCFRLVHQSESNRFFLSVFSKQ